MSTSTEFPIQDRADAFLFSVLKRLEVWHKARLTILLGAGLVGEDHPSLTHWKTFIESRVVALKKADGSTTKPEDILSFSSSLAWNGQVKYLSSRVGHGKVNYLSSTVGCGQVKGRSISVKHSRLWTGQISV